MASHVTGRYRRKPRINGASSDGARRDRTVDLLLAKQALSQLSYGPATAIVARNGAHPAGSASTHGGDGCAPGALAVGSAPAASLPSRGKCRVARRRSPTVRRALVMRRMRRPRGTSTSRRAQAVAGRSLGWNAASDRSRTSPTARITTSPATRMRSRSTCASSRLGRPIIAPWSTITRVGAGALVEVRAQRTRRRPGRRVLRDGPADLAEERARLRVAELRIEGREVEDTAAARGEQRLERAVRRGAAREHVGVADDRDQVAVAGRDLLRRQLGRASPAESPAAANTSAASASAPNCTGSWSIGARRAPVLGELDLDQLPAGLRLLHVAASQLTAAVRHRDGGAERRMPGERQLAARVEDAVAVVAPTADGCCTNVVSDIRVSRAKRCIVSSLSASASWTTARGLPASGSAVKTSSQVSGSASVVRSRSPSAALSNQSRSCSGVSWRKSGVSSSSSTSPSCVSGAGSAGSGSGGSRRAARRPRAPGA